MPSGVHSVAMRQTFRPAYRLLTILAVLSITVGCTCSEPTKKAGSEVAKLKQLCPLDLFEKDLELTFSLSLFEELDEISALDAQISATQAENRIEDVAAFNKKVQQYNTTSARLNTKLESFKAWNKDGKPLRFFNRTNQCYARLRAIQRRDGASFRFEPQLARAAKIRQHLQEHQRRFSQRNAGSIVLTSVRIGSEVGLYVLDTGASSVTISPEMVTALGWEDRKGKPITVTLAGGVREQLHLMNLEEVEVLGHKSMNVEGMIQGASGYGIDGLLGQSFLKGFTLQTDTTQTPQFSLTPKP
jgi:predicted aspartyl protease